MNIKPKNIPNFLKEINSWVVWKFGVPKRPGAKAPKIPYYTNGGKRFGKLGGPNDVKRLDTFENALAYAKANDFEGVGLAVLSQHDLTIIDLDNCIDDDGAYSPFAQRLVDTASYAELSPSGNGLRVVYRGAIISGKENFHLPDGERVEIYCGNAYTTFTGNEVEGSSGKVRKMPADLKEELVNGVRLDKGRVSLPDDSEPSEDEGITGVESGEVMSLNAVALPNMTTAQALRVLQGLPSKWGAPGEGTWYRVAAALHMQFDGSDDAYEVLDEWSKSLDGYDPDANRQRWDAGFAHDRGKDNLTSMRNLVFEARDNGVRFRDSTLSKWGLKKIVEENRAADEVELPDTLDDEIEDAWVVQDISKWNTPVRPPGTPALVRNWLYEGSVALFSSNGGGGKSFISTTFCTLGCLGATWFGEKMVEGNALYVNGEDPLIEVQSRLWGICRAYDIDMARLNGKLDIVDITSVLHKAMYTAGREYGEAEFTKHYYEMKKLIELGQYKYLVIDNISKVYMANENNRAMVDEFVSAMASIGVHHGLGVVLVGHTAKNSAEGYSGSTAWHNSARARWMLERKDDHSVLSVAKNNYGRTDHGGIFKWSDEFGVLEMGEAVEDTRKKGGKTDEQSKPKHDTPQDEELVLQAFLECYEDGNSTTTGARGPLGAIENHPDLVGFTPSDIRGHLQNLWEKQIISVEKYTRKDKKEGNRYCPNV